MSNNRKGGHPPVASRFRKGQSGNKNGRPKKRRAEEPSAFDIIINRTLTVEQHGEQHELPLDEALDHKTFEAAMAGDNKACREVLKWIVRREEYVNKKRKIPEWPGFRFEHHDPTNNFEAMKLLGIAAHCPERTAVTDGKINYLLIEPWAAQAALNRRSLRYIRSDFCDLICAWTRDFKSLHWPERFGYGNN